MLEEFVRALTPPALDRTTVSERKTLVTSLLAASTMSCHHMFESGSWSHGTGIKAKSDVDYMAWCTASRPTLPSSALASLKRSLSNWKINSVRVSSPVVQVEFLSPPAFEVAPCWYRSEINGFNTFWIPGRGDEWVLSAPDAHLAYVNQQNDRLSKRVKPLVRLLKAWKCQVGLPASSFYLEMRAAKYASDEQSIYYLIDLRRVIQRLVWEEFRDLNDPQGIVGRIPGCSSNDNRIASLRLAKEALDTLEKAEAAKAAGDKSAYWINMHSVFGSDFPWPED